MKRPSLGILYLLFLFFWNATLLAQVKEVSIDVAGMY